MWPEVGPRGDSRLGTCRCFRLRTSCRGHLLAGSALPAAAPDSCVLTVTPQLVLCQLGPDAVRAADRDIV